MNAYTIKKNTATKFLGLWFSIAYGFFVVASLQRLYLLDSGDINSYVNFFEDIDIFTAFNEYSIRGDGVFRIVVAFLIDFFNMEPLTVLSYLAFIISSIVFYIYSVNIRSSKYLIYILPLFLMVFFTPMVTNLFASAIRSGIAFTILMVAIVCSKGVSKYILFGLSSLIHLSMIPLIGLYFLFKILRDKKNNASSYSSYFLLILYSFFIAIAAYRYQFNNTAVNSSTYYNFLIFFLALLILFTNKKSIKNIYGFISIGLMLIVLSGIIIDVSFIRYIGYAIILYLFFLVDKGEAGTIQVFTAGYTPFFMTTLFYSIANFA